MFYTIGEISNKLGLPTSTIRYYDKEGLLPFIQRSTGGVRIFCDSDLEALNIIECLKATDMPIKDIRAFMQWCKEGDSTIQKRLDMFTSRKKAVELQLVELQKILNTIDFKCWYYETAKKAGSVDIHLEHEQSAREVYDETIKNKI